MPQSCDERSRGRNVEHRRPTWQMLAHGGFWSLEKSVLTYVTCFALWPWPHGIFLQSMISSILLNFTSCRFFQLSKLPTNTCCHFTIRDSELNLFPQPLPSSPTKVGRGFTVRFWGLGGGCRGGCYTNLWTLNVGISWDFNQLVEH